MKIVFIGRKFLFHSEDCAEEVGISEEFRKLGDEVVFLEKNELDSAEADRDVDFVFMAKQFNNIFQLQELDRLYPTAKKIFWMPDYCDLEGQTDNGFLDLVRSVDLYLYRLHRVKSWLDDHGVRGMYWNYDVADYKYRLDDRRKVLSFHPQTPYPDPIPVGFVGNWVHNPYRTDLLREIQQGFEDVHFTTLTMSEFDERCGLKNIHNPVYGDLFNQLVGKTKINLCIDHSIGDGYWSPRAARTMVAGGFVLMNEINGVRERFGNFVEYFSTADEAVEKIKFYLENESERAAFAEAGRLFAEENLRPPGKVKELRDHLLTLL